MVFQVFQRVVSLFPTKYFNKVFLLRKINMYYLEIGALLLVIGVTGKYFTPKIKTVGNLKNWWGQAVLGNKFYCR